MTTYSDSETLTRVGPGTPMGELMRHYWIPALQSDEVTVDGDPVRLMLLGEKLIAFRDTNGKVGVMDHRCPHRCASLFFGRNEEGGIRCVYHGWKFDADGNCLDMANVPPHQDFKHKVHAKAYKTAEIAGLVWVFMGDQAKVPPLPDFETLHIPDDERRITMVQRECNFMQALEGDLDTSHFGFLHAGSVKDDEVPTDHPNRFTVYNRAPEYEVTDTACGTMYGAYRPGDPGMTHWRVAHFLFPFWTTPPDGALETRLLMRAWVPMDDTHTMLFQIMWSKAGPSMRTDRNGATFGGMDLVFDYLPNTTDWLGRWRLATNRTNDYRIDRDRQRADRIYSGITGVILQDQAISESMGPITDHGFEHLAPSDRMIARTRRRMIQAARNVAKGEAAPGAADPAAYRGVRGGDFLWPEGEDMAAAYRGILARAANPTGRLIAAE